LLQKRSLRSERKPGVKIFYFLKKQKLNKMDKRNESLPADADAKKSEEDSQFKNQEEFDDQSRQQLDDQSRNEDKVRNKQKEESQTKHEDMIQPEKKKQTEKWDKVDRQFPNLKK